MAMYAAALVSRQLWSSSTLDSLQGRVSALRTGKQSQQQ